MPYGPHNAVPRPSHTGPLATDSRLFRITMLLLALVVRLVGVAERTNSIIHFKSPHRYMIVVPVRVNGMGPYSFLLDTGATSSAIDPQLTNTLHLSAAQSVKLASWEDTTDARRAVVNNLSVGPLRSGPLNVLVQPLSQFKAFDPHLRGVLGQDVLLRSNYLIDNRHHRIQFDDDGAVLKDLTGDRIKIAPVATRTGALEPRLISIEARIDRNSEPLHLLLDSGSDMLVLQPHYIPPVTVPRGSRWMADENGTTSAATTFHTVLSVGEEVFSAEAWTGDAGLKQLAIDGLLPTGSFNLLYISNQGAFVIFEPGQSHHRAVPSGP